MIKRDQANEEFLERLKGRTARAVQQYFFSHGICVSRFEIRKAMRLPEHEATFAALTPCFAQVNEAISLLSDIGSLSLASKEKSMRAVYEIEARLAERVGTVEGLETAVARIGVALRTVPDKPKHGPVVFWGTALVLMAFVAWQWALLGAMVYAAGVRQLLTYRKRKAAADRSLAEANAMFDAVTELEMTPRLSMLRE
ncbi:hypothetical protein [Caballeronia sp. LZ035]|uniref:hypothetical protein n=1 Tax=Caballeronia sp. LZ035 TaxID=3038568 RepID=UPI002855E84A|nr:hypothetical protein [Caballeronia sp. LZ035]MDR5758054.1 hypothetical protein [Caballeronia sp. LZ035]